MKQKILKKIFLVMLILLIIFSTFSFAKPIEENTTTPSTEIQPRNVEAISSTSETTVDTTPTKKEDDIFLTGSDITIDQEIYGNAYIIASNSVIISAPIHGNLFIFSNAVDFSIVNTQKPISISGSAYIYGTDINLDLYCQDLYVYAKNSLTISSDSCISRDIRGYAPTFNLYGIVKRNVFIETSNISFKNEENKKGTIEGNLSYYNTNSITLPEDLVIGEIFYNEKSLNTIPLWQINLYITITRFICSLLFFFILSRITPMIVKPEKGFILKNFFGTCLYGILTLFIVPVICLFAIYRFSSLLLFAIPVMLIYIAFIIIGIFAILIYITGLIQKALKKTSIWISIAILLGINIILYLLSFIPILSLIIGIFLIISGFGLLTQELFKKRAVS